MSANTRHELCIAVRITSNLFANVILIHVCLGVHLVVISNDLSQLIYDRFLIFFSRTDNQTKCLFEL